MNKKLMALAVAGAMFAPAVARAQAANVTIYGIMDVDLEVVSASASTAGVSIPSRERVTSNSSRLGFRGEEPLGNGMSAWFQIESSINGDGLGTSLGTRNTGVGLKGNFGTVLYGQWDTPLKVSTVGLDPFGDVGIGAYCGVLCGPSFNVGAAQASQTNVSAGQPFDTRLANNVQYWTPNWNGFSARAAYGADETKSNSNVALPIDPKVYGLSGSYAGGPWYATIAYEKHTDTGALAAGKGNDHDTRFALSYVWGPATLTGIYDTQSYNDDTHGTNYKRNAWQILGTYVAGPGTFRAYYTKANNATGSSPLAGAGTSANQFTVGYGYALSKRSEVYVLYTAINNSSAAAYDTSTAIGVKAAGLFGADPKGGLLGIKHVF
jgi:predicted porin